MNNLFLNFDRMLHRFGLQGVAQESIFDRGQTFGIRVLQRGSRVPGYVALDVNRQLDVGCVVNRFGVRVHLNRGAVRHGWRGRTESTTR